MLMIPVPYLFAVLALVGVWVYTQQDGVRNNWIIWFLSVLAFQEFLVGTRYGYDQLWLARIQPITASIIPPLAYHCFKRVDWNKNLVVHFWAFALVIASVVSGSLGMDVILALNNLFYATLIARIGLRGQDALDWVAFVQLHKIQYFLWFVVFVLGFSGLIDGIIVLDFALTQGENTSRIVGLSAFGALVLILLWLGVSRRIIQTPEQDKLDPASEQLFLRIDTVMREQRLHIDPDINLSRIARRLSLPARDVSRAINLKTGQSVSHYVNTLRIEEACALLRKGQMSVTEILYSVGYNSKSNFHRAFSHIHDQTPSQWRSANRDTV